MGLDIYAEKTGGHLHGSYSTLHHMTRYLALLYCGMPEYLDDNNSVHAFGIYMHPWFENKQINSDKFRSFIYAIQLSGLWFPNLLFHSDCEGTYTKRGKPDFEGSLMTGNSIALMKELEKLVNEKTFQDEKYTRHMEYTKAFYELVKNEVENGSGRIEFR